MKAWSSILAESVALRHHLHQHPELTWQEENTALLIREQLDQLNIPWRVCAGYGTVATLAPQAKGRHVALRADIDALPIQEAVDIAYRSKHEGCMHACGHDGHTAALWAAAAWLKQHESELPGPVSLLFQPAEEGGHGAMKMIEDGALQGIDVIYGWHNWPAIPFGQAVCPDATVMSGNGSFDILVTGQGGHASQPELCHDPVLAAAAITLNLQQIVSRRLAPQQAAVVSVSSIMAPSAATVTPQTAQMVGSIRLSHPSLREPIMTLIEQISRDTATTYGVAAEVTFSTRYDATVNHATAATEFRQVLQQTLGESWQDTALALPVMASEDFSYYLQQIPGAFALVGTAQQSEFSTPCHSPYYQFNDAVLEPVAAMLVQLAGLPRP